MCERIFGLGRAFSGSRGRQGEPSEQIRLLDHFGPFWEPCCSSILFYGVPEARAKPQFLQWIRWLFDKIRPNPFIFAMNSERCSNLSFLRPPELFFECIFTMVSPTFDENHSFVQWNLNAAQVPFFTVFERCAENISFYNEFVNFSVRFDQIHSFLQWILNAARTPVLCGLRKLS